MDPIEPIRLDTNLLNTALQIGMHQQGLQESERHHTELETLASSEQTLKDPDAAPYIKYQAANARYKIMAPGHGDLPPVDYSDNAPDWNNFVLNLNTKGSQSPEVMQSMQRLMQNSPYFRQKAEEFIKAKQQQEISQGMRSLPTRAGQPALTQEESLAAQHSAPLQKAIGEAAFPSPKETAVNNEVTARKAYFQTQEASLTKAHDALNAAVTPLFNADAESRLQQTLSSRKVVGRLGHDQAAADEGAMTTEELNAAKQTIPLERKQLSQQERILNAELIKSKHDVSGTARPLEQITAELDAVRQANFIKGRELAYAQNKSTANLQALQQAYADHEQRMGAYTQQIKALREAGLNVAQNALGQKKYQDSQEYMTKLIAAQSDFAKTDLSPKSAGIIGAKHGVLPEDVLKAGHNPDRPLVDIKMGESLGKEVGPMMGESRAAALGAIDTIDTVSRARSAIEKGMVNVGPTATIRQKVGQVAQMLGVGGKDNEEQIVNTRNVIRSLGQFSLAARKQLKGQGQVSDFEGKLLIKAESGDIEDMTLPELKSFLAVTDRLAHRQYDLHQHNLKTMRANPQLKEVAPFYDVPEIKKAAENVPTGAISKKEWDKLPSGSTYTAPDGTTRRKR